MAADVLEEFAIEVGPGGPVAAVGGRTHWHVGRVREGAGGGTREVRAPGGVVAHQPEEMIVRVRAGTTVAELDGVVGAAGQMCVLDPAEPERATVGGVLAAGVSGLRRLRYGPVRDALLEVRFVTAEGRLARAGGPVVKNVSGFDLCRLLVGSLGTLGLLAEVVLRCVPRPAAARWLRGDGADPFSALSRLYRPSSVLWDGVATWVLLEGHPRDIDDQVGLLGGGWEDVERPPPAPGPYRISVPPAVLGDRRHEWPSPWLAEIGVGTVHVRDPVTPPEVPATAARLHEAVKARFDPAGRLNPGRRPW